LNQCVSFSFLISENLRKYTEFEGTIGILCESLPAVEGNYFFKSNNARRTNEHFWIFFYLRFLFHKIKWGNNLCYSIRQWNRVRQTVIISRRVGEGKRGIWEILKGHWRQQSVSNQHMGGCLMPSIWTADIIKNFLIVR
jgi:hypothetical protein